MKDQMRMSASMVSSTPPVLRMWSSVMPQVSSRCDDCQALSGVLSETALPGKAKWVPACCAGC